MGCRGTIWRECPFVDVNALRTVPGDKGSRDHFFSQKQFVKQIAESGVAERRIGIDGAPESVLPFTLTPSTPSKLTSTRAPLTVFSPPFK